jgi:hypothetical protein
LWLRVLAWQLHNQSLNHPESDFGNFPLVLRQGDLDTLSLRGAGR